jgi:hypothetical protein
MDDASIRDRIDELVAEEQRLLRESEGAPHDDARHARLDELRIELDQCWDLLRQRRALREAGRDADDAEARRPEVVERYEQ